MSSVETKFEVYGLKQSLTELAKTDRKLRLQITRDFKQLTNSLVGDIKAHIPTEAPLSGMDRKWVTSKSHFQMFPWNGRLAATLVKQKASTKKPREFGGITRNLAVFYVSWQGQANTVFDMAGRKHKNALGDALTATAGKPSRIMYPAFERHENEIQQGMFDIVQKVGDAVGRRLNVVGK